MQKKYLFIILLLMMCCTSSFAFHLKGGWIQYEYLGSDSAAKTNKYRITVRQYLSCNSSDQQIDAAIFLGIFDGSTNKLFSKLTVPLTSTTIPSKTSFDACITPKPLPGSVCYRIDLYSVEVNLPFNDAGYTLAVQRCCRISGIINLINSDQFGLTYTNTIPGKILGNWYSNNNSPVFDSKDTVIICHNSPFTFDFSATDVDGDSLKYSFCEGLHGGSGGQNGNPRPDPPSNPPYNSIAYQTPFSGASPMGFNVNINWKTGLIAGTAPNTTGDYVIAVCVTEFRNGIIIGVTKKEIHINVANCELSAADLKPTYITCDGFTLNFQNESTSTAITAYNWSFGDDSTSKEPTPIHTYKDTGVYKLKLVVQSQGCTDSAQAIVRIFPGFIPDFNVTGFCYQNPFLFKSTTIAKYGIVDTVHWDFGDVTTNNDTATQKNTSYKYGFAGQKKVRLYAHSSKGCDADTIKIVTVLEKPTIILPFKDTLICSIDTLPLLSSSNGQIFSWSPNKFITNTSILNPLVFPKDTIKYILTVTDNGCINRDTVTVNVLDFISVDAGPNANVCLTDGYRMLTKSDALGYRWTPALTLNDSTIKHPTATPTSVTTKYYVTANLGKCQDRDSVTLFTFPYPVAKVSADTTICRGDSVQIFGVISADVFSWTPTKKLMNFNTLSPFAKPDTTIKYILTAKYLTGCLKPVRDTVTINIIQPFTVFAGRDTMIVFNQPLQLNAIVKSASDKSFLWTTNPYPNFLNNIHIQSPIGIFPKTIDSVLYSVKAFTKENCYALDTIKIKIFKTNPSIFVPGAFTPNNDGLNDIIKPICVGITQLNYFSIYNRWGQQMFTTSTITKGWDGSFNGIKQNSGTFVYTVQGIDYLGNIITQKGTVVLIQ